MTNSIIRYKSIIIPLSNRKSARRLISSWLYFVIKKLHLQLVRGCLTIGVQFKECSKVQYAIQIIEKVLGEGIKSVKEGMTELDLTAEFEYLMRKFGAEGPSFSTTVLSGDKSSLPHGSPDRKIINKGDFLLIDMELSFNQLEQE